MAKIAAGVVAIIIGWAAVANATITLEITGGSAGGTQAISCLEPGANVSGANFTFTGFSGTTYCPGVTNVDTMRLVGTLTLNGVTFPGNCVPTCLDNTTFSFTNDPFPEPPILAPFAYHGPYQTTFTMTGHTDVGPPGGVDFFGHGTTTLGLIFSDASHESGLIFERFDFAVPEPSTLALLFGGLVMMLVVHRRWAARDGLTISARRTPAPRCPAPR